MDAQHEATIRAAADRHPVNAFSAHHFAGLGCCTRRAAFRHGASS
ncbi:hypothetical protein [Streptomyces barringtoniae]|nr:hypothetical protein [Streptomyces barringtoniae]